jgi:neopullulanase
MTRLRAWIPAISLIVAATATANPIERIDPPSWWVGFEAPTVELLIHGDSAGSLTPSVHYPGVTVSDAHALPNGHYLSLTLAIAKDAEPGRVPIDFSNDSGVVAHVDYPLEARREGSRDRRGFDSHDTVYLIMPDRFANGDPSNDAAPGTRDHTDRNDPNARHGGDLKGITAHLDWLADMGYTQLWLTPVLENDMPTYSYHGYSITDHYKVDPRFGSNEDYRALADAARQHGIGLVEDVVINHIGLNHWWMKDLPDPEWLSNHGVFERSNHYHKSMIDIHAAPSERQRFIDGWFDSSMPDLHPVATSLGNYLIENAIWWIEYAGLSGVRIDTYPYTDKTYTAEYCRRILAEYPHLNIVGEEAPGKSDPVIISYWQAGRVNQDGYVSTLPTLMDFPVRDAMIDALLPHPESSNRIREIYEVLADDVIYGDPNKLLVMADNHDTDRIFHTLKHDDRTFRMAMAFIATVRGIPQVTYGTEFEWTNEQPGDGYKRLDFPGGFAGDTANAFTGEDLDARSWETMNYLRTLFRWRSGSKPVQDGTFRHYVPEHDVYVYFRQAGTETVMVVLNNNTTTTDLPLARYRETMGSVHSAVDPISHDIVSLGDSLKLEPKSALILELQP